ncbi:hypothetical protein, partial [Leptotrichia sp. OH3620_COT-345]|uniref:hypothetical protein n=1 Tax=Leptotrichia sp. OH3620_COT-345 TaxID=2491048 RepID=UPI001315793F
NKGIRNIGGVIRGSEITKVTSEKGKVLNESTISSDTLTRTVRTGGGFLRSIPKTYTEVYGITESIRNIGKVEGEGLVYVEGKEIENIAGNIRGRSGTLLKSTEKDIVDKTITLRDERQGVSETVTVTK